MLLPREETGEGVYLCFYLFTVDPVRGIRDAGIPQMGSYNGQSYIVVARSLEHQWCKSGLASRFRNFSTVPGKENTIQFITIQYIQYNKIVITDIYHYLQTSIVQWYVLLKLVKTNFPQCHTGFYSGVGAGDISCYRELIPSPKFCATSIRWCFAFTLVVEKRYYPKRSLSSPWFSQQKTNRLREKGIKTFGDSTS